MLTPYLETLIHQGKAIYKTAVVGAGAASAVVIPNNTYAVLTDLLYYPYMDNEGVNYGTPDNIDIKPFINQVWIRSRLGNNHFLFRPNIDTLHVDGSNAHPFIGHVSVNTYLIHDGVIRISVSQIDSPTQWVSVDNSALPDISNEESAGYGTASIAPNLAVLKGIQFSNNQWYRPPTNVRDPQPANVSGGDQYRQNPSAGFNQRTGIGSSNQAVPILNIGYVQIQGKPPALTS